MNGNNSLQSLFSSLLRKETSYCLHIFYNILFFTIITQGVLVAHNQLKNAILVGVVALAVFAGFITLMSKRMRDYLNRDSFQEFKGSQYAVLVPSFLQIRQSIVKWSIALSVCFGLVCIPYFGTIFSFFFVSSLLALIVVPKDKVRPFLQRCSLIMIVLGALLCVLATTTNCSRWYAGCCALTALSLPSFLISKKTASVDSKLFMKLERTYSKMYEIFGILLFLFLFAPIKDQQSDFGIFSCVFIFLICYPLATLLLRSISMNKTIKAFADKTSSTISRDCITGSNNQGDSEQINMSDLNDCVRESDGYYRVCLPQYFNENPLRAGECGYLASPEEDKTTFPLSDGGWVVFRNLSSVVNVLRFRQDEIGISCRNTLSALVASLLDDVYSDVDKSYFNNLLKPWIVRVRKGDSTKDYLKTPWESGEILGVPISKSFLFQYPLGCGIVDEDTIPCGVKLTVQISLKQELIDAVERFSKLSPEECKTLSDSDYDVRLLRNFLVRYNLIVPSVYEAFFIRFLEKIKTLRCFQPDEEKRRDIDRVFQETFSGTTDISMLLPKEIAELVNLSVRDAGTTQLIVTDKRFNVFAKLKFWQEEKDIKYFEQMRNLDQIFTNLILRGAAEGVEEVNVLQRTLDEQFNAICQATQTGGELLANAIAEGGNQNSPHAMNVLQESLNRFSVKIRNKQAECRKKLSNITAILQAF